MLMTVRSQARAWVFTMWSEDDVGRLKSCAGVKAMVVGEEKCPTTGKIHYQGYVRFDDNKRMSWWKNQFPGAHCETRRGTEAEAAAYCRKEGKVLVDFGCAVPEVKSANPAENAVRMIFGDAPLWQVCRSNPMYFFHNYKKIEAFEGFVRGCKENGWDCAGDF